MALRRAWASDERSLHLFVGVHFMPFRCTQKTFNIVLTTCVAEQHACNCREIGSQWEVGEGSRVGKSGLVDLVVVEDEKESEGTVENEDWDEGEGQDPNKDEES